MLSLGGAIPVMNCRPSAVGSTNSLLTNLKLSSVFMQRLTSTNSTSPVCSAVQAQRNVT